jgi:hypothetical protein
MKRSTDVGFKLKNRDWSPVGADDFMKRVAAQVRGDRRQRSARGFGQFRRCQNEAPQGQYAHRDWFYWDTASVAAGAAFPQIVFFAVPQGAAGKNLNVTNLQGQGGQLPAGEVLTITSIRIEISNLTVPADFQNINNLVSVQFKVRNYPILQCTPEFLSPGFGAVTASAAQLGVAPAGTATVTSTSNGLPTQASVYNFAVPYVLGSLENFAVILNPETAFNMVAAAATNPLGVGTTIKVALEGVIDRLLAG